MSVSAPLAERASTTTLYIDGAWHAANGEPVDVFDPTDEQVLASPASASTEDVEAALESARRAQRGWAATPARSGAANCAPWPT